MWSERRTFNPEVRGSSPRVGTKVLPFIGRQLASESARGARLSSISPIATRLIDYMKLRIYPWYASCVKDCFSKHMTHSWDALNGSYVKSCLILHWWGDAPRRVLMYEVDLGMYGVPGR